MQGCCWDQTPWLTLLCCSLDEPLINHKRSDQPSAHTCTHTHTHVPALTHMHMHTICSDPLLCCSRERARTNMHGLSCTGRHARANVHRQTCTPPPICASRCHSQGDPTHAGGTHDTHTHTHSHTHTHTHTLPHSCNSTLSLCQHKKY